MNKLSDHGGNVFALARSLGIEPEHLLDFSASINPLGPAPGVREAVCSSFMRVTHYPDRDALELRQALAAFHHVCVDNIVVANGSTELIYLVPRFLQGRRGLIVGPAFSEYGRALEQAGWEAEQLILSPESGFEFSLEMLAKRLAEGVDLLWLCNPANPTGVLLSRVMLGEIVRLCHRSGTFLVLDEAFMDFCEGESAKGLVVEAGGGMVLRSMTKFFAIPGLRLGYAIAADDIVRRCAGQLAPWSVNSAAQVAGIASLAALQYRERTVSRVAKKRDELFQGLAALPGLTPFPSAANYLLVKMCNALTAGELRNRLLSYGIIIRDCSNFVGLDDRFFRVAVRTGEENRRLLSALAEVLGEQSP